MGEIPSEEEVLGYVERLSNWGRWGTDDSLGCLNLITDAKRIEAAALIRHGRTVSCSWDIETGPRPDDTGAPPLRYMVTTGEGVTEPDHLLSHGLLPTDRQSGASEFLGLEYHGFRVTHLDALSHIFLGDRMYNNFPSSWVASPYGATRNAVTAAREGIITRGLLVDVPRHRDVPWLEPGEGVSREELEEILAAAGCEVRSGDALLLRTGYGRRRAERGPDRVGRVGRAGWQASCLPFFHEHDIAFIGADTAQDVVPSGYERVRVPIHAVGIVAMGLWLLDNCNLEPLAQVCEELGTAEFALLVAALPFAGATGSPVNPIAVF